MIRRVAAVFVLSFLIASAVPAATAPGWVTAASAAVIPSYSSDTAAVVLLDESAITVAPSGEMTTQRRRVVKILTVAGKEYAYGAAAFDDRTKLRSLRGWKIAPDGKVTAVRERQAVETSAGDFELFTDAKLKVLDLSGEPGTIVAYESETREMPYEPVALWRFQESIPVLRARLTLQLSPGWTHAARWIRYEPPASAGSAWELTNIEPVAEEPRMPAPASVAAWAGISWGPQNLAPRTWKDVGGWYAALATPRLAPTDALKAKVRALGAEGDIVRALARHAQNGIRYVAIAIGIGGYQPHPAGEVLTNSYGDCKDKATLLKAMLREAGIESHYLLVNTTRGMVEPSFPSISAFDHVISAIRIPKADARRYEAVLEHPTLGSLLLFDPTSTTTAFGHLPAWLQSSHGLLVTEDGGELVELPAHTPAASELRRVAKLQLSGEGTLHGTVEEIWTGDLASSMRATLQPLSHAERVRFVDATLSYHLARQTAADVRIENLEDAEADLRIRYTLTAPSYATRVADLLLVRPRVVGVKGERAIASSARKYAYVTDGPSRQMDEVAIAMPATARLDELPKSVAIDTPLVQYTSSTAFEAGVLRYQRSYVMQGHVVPAGQTKDLREAFARIAADERANAVFK